MAAARGRLKGILNLPNREEEEMALLKQNDVAPAFSIPNQDGTLISLSQFKGKHVVLWWFPKADTPG